MGVGAFDLEVILKLRRNGILPGKFSVAEIGAQQLGDGVLRDSDLLQAYAEAFDVPYRDFGRASSQTRPSAIELLRPDAPFTKDFWEWLGCAYMAADVDTAPHTIRLDLNFDDVPARHKGKYQLVTNFGTTEHVANQNQAMKIMHDLAAVGGVMVHNVPMQGYSNHGMFNYNPKFFWLLSRSCRYRFLDMRVTWDVVSTPISSDIADEVAKYDPANAEQIRRQRAVDAGLIVVLQKIEDIPFVPPIDTSSAEIVADETARARYWTVFGGAKPQDRLEAKPEDKPRRFERLLRWRSRS
jgi:hypothetical protein